jgi:hypothetical protein
VRTRNALAVVLLVAAACSGDDPASSTVTIGEGAESPVAAVEEIRSSLTAGDFATAGSLSVPDQAALASLAEGADFESVAEALDDGGAEISANFWGGFAQGVGEVLTNELAIEDRGSTTESGVEFFLVGVTPEGGTERRIVTRDVDGQRVDLFASFGASLAGAMVSPVELLLGTSTDESRAILAALREVVPSLLVAASDPDLSPEAVQGILQLVEMITRVG